MRLKKKQGLKIEKGKNDRKVIIELTAVVFMSHKIYCGLFENKKASGLTSLINLDYFDGNMMNSRFITSKMKRT